MSREIGIGVIGMGWMGLVHSRVHRSIPDRFPDAGFEPRLVICADDVAERATEAQRRLGFEATSTNWRDVIADSRVDVVIVTAPNCLHREMVEAACQAGKHVFCEKPVGISPQETAAIAHTAAAAGVISGVGYNYRWAPLVQYGRELIQAGTLGDITHYRGRFLVGYGSNPDSVLSWRFQREYAGTGVLGDLMSHVVDMAHMLAGSIERVVGNQRTFISSRPLATRGEGTHFSTNAEGPRGEVTNEDYVGALAGFHNGAQGTLEVCRVVNGPRCEMAFEINGTAGAMQWNFERMNELRLFVPDASGTHDGPSLIQVGPNHPSYASFYPGPANSMSYEDLKLLEAYHFLQGIATGEQGEPGLREGLAVAEVLHAIQESWTSQKWESVKPIEV